MCSQFPLLERVGKLGNCRCVDCQCDMSVPKGECRCSEHQSELLVTPVMGWSKAVNFYDEGNEEIRTADRADGQKLLITPMPPSGINKLAQSKEKPDNLAVALKAHLPKLESDMQDVTDFGTCKTGMTQGTLAPASVCRSESEPLELIDDHELIGMVSKLKRRLCKAPLPEPDVQDVTDLNTCKARMTWGAAVPASACSLGPEPFELIDDRELIGMVSNVKRTLSAEKPAKLAEALKAPSPEPDIQDVADFGTCKTGTTQGTETPSSACSVGSEPFELIDDHKLIGMVSNLKRTLSAKRPASLALAVKEPWPELEIQGAMEPDICRMGGTQSTATPASARSLESHVNEVIDHPDLSCADSEVANQMFAAESICSSAIEEPPSMQEIINSDARITDLMQSTTATAVPAAVLAAAPTAASSLDSELTELADSPGLHDLDSEMTEQALSAEQLGSLALAPDGYLHKPDIKDISDRDTSGTDLTHSTALANVSTCCLNSEVTEPNDQSEHTELLSEATEKALSAEQPGSLAAAFDGPLHEPDIRGVTDLDTCGSILSKSTTASAAAPAAPAAAICSSESELCELTDYPEVKDFDFEETEQTLSDWYSEEEDDGQFIEVAPASLKLADAREEYENFRKFKSTSSWLRDGQPHPSCESDSTKTYIVHDTFKSESSDHGRVVLPFPYPYSFQ